MSSSMLDLLSFAVFIFFVQRLWIHFTVHRRFPLPPGPKGWPIIGNLFDLPKEKAYFTNRHTALTDSDLLYFNAAGTSMLILNSAEVANDLLVGRWKMYSDRPPLPMAYLAGVDFSFALLSYGDNWRKHRSLLKRELSPLHLPAYQKPQLQESMIKFLHNLLETPQQFESHVHLLFGGTLLSSAYGLSIEDPGDYYLMLVKEAMRAIGEVMIPGTYIVDIFPVLRYLPAWLPGVSFKKKAAQERVFIDGMIHETMSFVKKDMKNGMAKSSIASRQLQKMHDEGTWSEEEETVLRNLLASLYGAGTDTTAATTMNIILGFLLNPDSLKKGQAAVDAALGFDRLPNYGDEGKIPYVDAVVMEALRWQPVVPLSMNLLTIENADIYGGHYIPANTIVLENTWAILHDPATYGEDVDQFRPGRFLNPDGTLNNAVPYPSAAFGYGRRTCPGKSYAQSALWLTVASLLSCFDFSKPVNEKGEEIHLSVDYIDGLITHPSTFECIIRPRSKVVERLIRQKREQQVLS
ncbi:hypothetical protein GYMLUDRAFT_1005937 [Collybiopsis luxurians FD-317 M1]|uniref:Cytochrome P450 n=1 Tax=Collybiopsis luxurians FD-317 M1 TaxID=944289 RepID=A0A0D0B5K8_9AGAR|nr:hypothetical protein GYMLUDRAFT_1005937 [Collybiopsis luxurians FD-317 M1]